jgi:hypothetical protein
MKKFHLLLALSVLFLLCMSPATAQLNPFAPPSASEPITSASPTGGLSSSTFINRAQEAAAAPVVSAPRGISVAEGGPVGAGKNEFGDRGPTVSAPLAAPPVTAPGAPPAIATPAIKWVKVLAGERVKDAINGSLLEDVHYEYVPETMLKDNFYDDGTHGDQEAGDGLYTNITERTDVLGQQSNDVKLQMLSLLATTEDMSPLDFFRLHVTTSEPISSVPNSLKEESLRDERLKEWNRTFLRPYRKKPDDPTSEFYPVYVPQPPRVPVNNPPMPQGFNPIEQERLQQEAARAARAGGGSALGRGQGGAIEGSPQGGSSSRYYDSGKMP